jgi:uncharacterized protein (DUF305 family)
MIRSVLPAAFALSLVGSLALAQEASDGSEAAMEGMDHSAMAEGTAMADMMTAMDGMMSAMPTESSGMVDADFLLMMIPHHQSAIDMARVELEQGADEETRTMAQEIIDAQEAEIAEMRTMLERMGVEPPAATEAATTDGSGTAEEPAAQ